MTDVAVLKGPHLLGRQPRIPGLGRSLLFNSQNGKAEVRTSLNIGVGRKRESLVAGRRKRETWRSGLGFEMTLYHILQTRFAEKKRREGGRC